MSSTGLLAQGGQPPSPFHGRGPSPFQGLIGLFQPLERVRELYRRAQQPVNSSILDNVLSEMRVSYMVTDIDMARIPAKGAVVVTANHPFGLLDGAVLGAVLSRVRSDVRILTNFLLADIPELHEHCIFVDPFGDPESATRNRRGVRQALAWLSTGGMLVVFPAGEVSHVRVPELIIADPQWKSMAARLARFTGADALPVFLPGHNSAAFQALGLLHPRMRTALLLTEFLQQKNRTVEVRIGRRIPAETLQEAGSDHQAVGYLRWRTYILAQRGRQARSPRPIFAIRTAQAASSSISAEASPQVLARELENLARDKCLFENSEFSVHCAKAPEIPHLLLEIGRLREITFRAAGEGTGMASDLDRFDDYYTHVFLWSKATSQLAGAYRMGPSTDILPRMGVSGFYTSTLFRYHSRFFGELGPALELGRSFVRREYQKHYAPLFYLWKGIGKYLARNPQFAVLFGAVSISDRYSHWSRELIYRFFQARERNQPLSKLVTPRCPFHSGWVRPCGEVTSAYPLKDLEKLEDPIADVELDGKGIPILLKHYVKLGGRILSFNVDKDFSGVLDGLVLVDLRRAEPAALQRYMGPDGLATFQKHHVLPETCPL